MVAYNFKKQFADSVRRGDKSQTIRATGRRKHVQPGGAIQLYTGMRTKSCEKLADAICMTVSPIEMSIDDDGLHIWENGQELSFDEMEALAEADGFTEDPLDEFIRFFEARMPFSGVVITWSQL